MNAQMLRANEKWFTAVSEAHYFVWKENRMIYPIEERNGVRVFLCGEKEYKAIAKVVGSAWLKTHCVRV